MQDGRHGPLKTPLNWVRTRWYVPAYYEILISRARDFGLTLISVKRLASAAHNGTAAGFVLSQTQFYANLSVSGFDHYRVGESFAEYLSVVLKSFTIHDLPGSDGIIYGTLSTSAADQAGNPIVWEGFFLIPFEKAEAFYDQDLSGRALLEVLDIIAPSQ